MTWLVTGGAGYIGAHVVRALREDGVDVVVLDDLSTGDASRLGDVPLVRASTLDREAIDRTLVEHGVVGVVHIAANLFAALATVYVNEVVNFGHGH